MIELFHHALRLHADPSRVVVRPFHLAWAGNGGSRTERLVREVMELDTAATRAELEIVLKDFEARHWQTRRVFMTPMTRSRRCSVSTAARSATRSAS